MHQVMIRSTGHWFLRPWAPRQQCRQRPTSPRIANERGIATRTYIITLTFFDLSNFKFVYIDEFQNVYDIVSRSIFVFGVQ